MRYESFYPFAHNQPPPPRPQNIGQNMFMPPVQNQGQMPHMGGQQQPFTNHIPGQPGGQEGSKLESYMQTADRFLSTAQQFAPIVQQFAPMMRNIPAMWRLYKGFQNMPEAGGAASTAASTAASASAAQSAAQMAAEAAGPRPSVPRIFQPPSP